MFKKINLKQTYFVCFFLFLFCASALGQKEESTVPANKPTNFRLTDMLRLKEYSSTLCLKDGTIKVTCPSPSYGFFWIFGDGHFDYVQGETVAARPPASAYTSPWLNYNSTVPKEDIYPIVTYITNIYSDTPPPDFKDQYNKLNTPDSVKMEAISSGVVGSSMASTFSNSIDYKPSPATPSSVGKIRRASIVTNQEPRVSFPMVFSLSFIPTIDIEGFPSSGAIHLLYNDEIVNKENVLEQSSNLYPPVFEYEKSYLPHYYNGTDSDISASTSTVGLPYTNMVTYRFDSDEVPSDNFMRLFHAFFVNKAFVNSTKQKDKVPIYKFLAILTAQNHQTDSLVVDFEEDELNTIIDQGGNFGNTPSENYRIVDVVEFELPVNLGNDPNKLCVTDIYEDENVADSYKVFFNLLVCNDGLGAANYINLELTDNTKLYNNLVLEKFAGLGNSAGSFPITKPFNNSYTYTTTDFFLNGVIVDQNIGQCTNVTFSVETNSEGVSALLEEDAITASVQLVENGHKEIAKSKPYHECNDIFDDVITEPEAHTCLGIPLKYWCIILLILLILCCIFLIKKKL